MNFYHVTAYEGDKGNWFPTLTTAHKHAKSKPNRIDVQIDLFDVQVDKTGVLELLSGYIQKKHVKSWRLSTRGGLIECSPSQQSD
jgi:hypothetical protein